ncbi:MAG: ParB family transcriptional regulator, chromosome partitioning protein [Actinomycetota bacterium]|nr:ParB family transcriptional regulator, chromosome partitioning protein [Actinomycetota bacterium]
MTRRSGLGRGLDALLPDETARPESGTGIGDIAIDEIDANPRQPRDSFDEPALRELADSISSLGVLQPVVVRKVGGRYELVAGERRVRAARIAGLDRVPVVVVDTDGRGSLERALVENIHRADLNAIEEAAAYRQLLDEGGLTHESLASQIGKNRVSITNALRLLELPVPVQKLITEGRLSAAHGKALLGLQGNPFQQRLATRAAQERLSARETEDLVRRFQAMTGVARSDGDAPTRPPQVTDAQRVLSARLQTRVRVEVGKRKGKITIDFVSLEELDRLMALLTDSITLDVSEGPSSSEGQSSK